MLNSMVIIVSVLVYDEYQYSSNTINTVVSVNLYGASNDTVLVRRAARLI